MGRGVKADALGDQSAVSNEGEGNDGGDDDNHDGRLEKEEAAVRSDMGSVF